MSVQSNTLSSGGLKPVGLCTVKICRVKNGIDITYFVCEKNEIKYGKNSPVLSQWQTRNNTQSHTIYGLQTTCSGRIGRFTAFGRTANMLLGNFGALCNNNPAIIHFKLSHIVKRFADAKCASNAKMPFRLINTYIIHYAYASRLERERERKWTCTSSSCTCVIIEHDVHGWWRNVTERTRALAELTCEY